MAKNQRFHSAPAPAAPATRPAIRNVGPLMYILNVAIPTDGIVRLDLAPLQREDTDPVTGEKTLVTPESIRYDENGEPVATMGELTRYVADWPEFFEWVEEPVAAPAEVEPQPEPVAPEEVSDGETA